MPDSNFLSEAGEVEVAEAKSNLNSKNIMFPFVELSTKEGGLKAITSEGPNIFRGLSPFGAVPTALRGTSIWKT